MNDDGVQISNVRTGHAKTLGYDHIYKFTSNSSEGGFRNAFLSLHVQLFMQGDEVRLIPNTRPGESVRPTKLEIIEKVVELSYPESSGMQARLMAQGYKLYWARKERVAGLIGLNRYEEVIDRDSRGKLASFRSRDGLVLLKCRVDVQPVS